jgi:hypothetical protein
VNSTPTPIASSQLKEFDINAPPVPPPGADRPTVPPNDTEFWYTYTNAKYSYSVKYPATYSLNNNSTQPDSVEFYPAGYGSLTPQQMQTTPTITINVTTLTSSPQDWVNMLKAPGYSNVRNKTDITIGNAQGIQYTFNNTQAGNGQAQLETVMPLENSSLLLITLNDASNDSDVEIYNQILSTFQFTK